MLITPDPPRPTPTGPIVDTAMTSATTRTITLVLDSELWPLPIKDSAGDAESPALLNNSHAAR